MLNLDTLGLNVIVSATGITAPDFETIRSTLVSYFQEIYGGDSYLDADSKDGQMVTLYALGIHDANNSAIAVYNSFSPATAVGNGLSSNVKINGIKRDKETNSTVDVLITGNVGLEITNGAARDADGVRWDLPASVIIGLDGTATATAICSVPGAIVALSNTVKEIATPTRGWLTVNNPTGATLGKPVEVDAELRVRQAVSVALPSRTVLDGILGAIAGISGVERYRGYENDTSITDGNGIPSHSISIVVDGGDATQIAQAIALKKGPGSGTYGTTTIPIPDKYGIVHPINFFRKGTVIVYVRLEIKALQGYTSSIGTAIKNSIAEYINEIEIGEPVRIKRLDLPAQLNGSIERLTYDITLLEIGISPVALSENNIEIAFNNAAACVPENITLVVT
ncbi:baseplate J/gp47 family protein [Yersinia enterocolitica]|uniref:baseplate J/gp47 family protein n=1 Tax=Yersinia enterocolitica TaxID=630 RepID=UPI0021E87ED0|nr:baseplate J/gp47 family protein [Yersinia enterocolitica]UYJ99177.1 baseplate J/gp47 family protein [Yersinia enterocolitica]